MTKGTTGDHSDLMGTRAEERFIVTKNRQKRMTSVVFASQTITLPKL